MVSDASSKKSEPSKPLVPPAIFRPTRVPITAKMENLIKTDSQRQFEAWAATLPLRDRQLAKAMEISNIEDAKAVLLWVHRGPSIAVEAAFKSGAPFNGPAPKTHSRLNVPRLIEVVIDHLGHDNEAEVDKESRKLIKARIVALRYEILFSCSTCFCVRFSGFAVLSYLFIFLIFLFIVD